tara:strand:- start:15610 stop:17505 length:1896 start_codon:yes stop_codon:yes gene_type:complete
MAFQVSPGVNISEIDLTGVIPAVSTTNGAVAGEFLWGPIEERILIESEDELVTRFWKPNNNVASVWFTAANFLGYGNQLYVVRAANLVAATGANNATGDGTGVQVKNDVHYENNYADGSLSKGDWIAKYPGALGNNLKVSVCATAAAFQSTLTGNVSVTANSTAVTGLGTLFDTELIVGDFIQLNGIEGKVSAIASNVALTLAARHSVAATANVSVVRNWEYYNKVDVAPGTSTYVSNLSGVTDEVHVVVVDEDGEISNLPNTVLEKYEAVSLASDAKTDNGSTNYYKEVINQTSTWIRWADHSSNNTNAGSLSAGVTFGGASVPESVSLAGGTRGTAPSDADKIRAYDLFKDPADVDLSLVMGADATQTIALHLVNNIGESRKDLLVCLSPFNADVVNNDGSEATSVVTTRNLLPSSSYATMDSSWKYQYDKYNDLYRYLPMNGDVAGLCAHTDIIRDPWWSPAGFNRGNIKNVIKLSYNPSTADRNVLYKAGVNPILNQPGQGVVLFGDKTMLSKPSAFDRINVRRLFIVLEKAIATAAKFMLFEFNDEFTRSQFRNMVEPFLRDIQGRRGIHDFRVVADETNNTGEVIDRNEFVGDIYIKPARSINFIQLNFVAVRTGVEFTEIIGKF